MSSERKRRILWEVAEHQVVNLRAGSGVLRALVADTPEKRIRGLHGLASLPSNTGMLFIMSHEGPARFWMRGIHVPLDIAVLDRLGRVLAIGSMEPETGSLIHAGPVKYAVEASAGWFSQNDVSVGDVIRV